MDRCDAERVFELVADLSGDLKGKFIHERWWLVNVFMGVETLVSCCASQWLILAGRAYFANLVVLWMAHVAVIALTIFGLHRKQGGQRTVTEAHIWWIWSTFVLISTLLASVNFLAGNPMAASLMSVLLLAAFAWSMMAMITYRWILCVAAFFVGLAVSMPFVAWPLVLFGIGWLIALTGIGLALKLSYRPTESQIV